MELLGDCICRQIEIVGKIVQSTKHGLTLVKDMKISRITIIYGIGELTAVANHNPMGW